MNDAADPDWEALLDRYVAGECSDVERVHVERWIAASAERAELVRALRAVAADIPPAELAQFDEAHRTAAWGRLTRAIAAEESREEPPSSRRRVAAPTIGVPVPATRWPARASALAAAAVLIIGVSFAWRASRAGQVSAPPPPVVTARAERRSLRLADGTRVILGAESRLQPLQGFGERTREVRLEGEAYFDVVHDDGRPFIVRAGDLVATDIGTEFVVRAYPEERGARIVVAKGSVSFRSASTSDGDTSRLPARVLAPGQLGRLSPQGAPVVEAADTGAYLAWTEGRLVFDSVPLSEVLAQLGRWYDVDFRLADSTLGRREFHGAFQDRPLADVLEALAAALPARYERQGRTIVLLPR